MSIQADSIDRVVLFELFGTIVIDEIASTEVADRRLEVVLKEGIPFLIRSTNHGGVRVLFGESLDFLGEVFQFHGISRCK